MINVKDTLILTGLSYIYLSSTKNNFDVRDFILNEILILGVAEAVKQINK